MGTRTYIQKIFSLWLVTTIVGLLTGCGKVTNELGIPTTGQSTINATVLVVTPNKIVTPNKTISIKTKKKSVKIKKTIFSPASKPPTQNSKLINF